MCIVTYKWNELAALGEPHGENGSISCFTVIREKASRMQHLG